LPFCVLERDADKEGCLRQWLNRLMDSEIAVDENFDYSINFGVSFFRFVLLIFNIIIIVLIDSIVFLIIFQKERKKERDSQNYIEIYNKDKNAMKSK